MSTSGPFFTAYTGIVPSPDAEASPTSPASPSSPTYDFKVMLIRAKHLYTPTSTLDASTPVYVQLQVLDSRGTAIAPHFRYKSTLKVGPDPEWCESVLLKHLPCKPAQLEFSFYAQPPAATQPVPLGAVVAGSELLGRYWPAVADVKTSVHSRYHRVSGGEAGADAQFHYVLAPAYARLRHLTTAQSKPPLIALVSPASAAAAPAAGLPIPRRSPPQTPIKAPPPLVTSNSASAISTASPPAVPPFPALPPLPPLPHLDTSTPIHFQSNPLLSPPPPLPPTPAPLSQPLSATDDAKRLALRDRSIREFYDTERSYYTNLGILYTEFVVPLRQAVLERKEINVSGEQVDKMINNIETIYKFHSSFLADLENQNHRGAAAAATATAAATNGGGGGGGSGVSVGSVMLKYAQFFKIYISYLNGYEPSIGTINSLRNNRRFQDFLTRMRARLNDISLLDLTSYLIMPVQRVPRYVLLLSSILSYTLSSDSEYELLHAALDSIKSVAMYVNEGKKHVENLSKLVDVQDRISGGSDVPQLVEPYRRFVREGVMVRVSSGGLLGGMSGTLKEKRSVFFLFSDLLLWASASHQYKGSIWLVSASVERKNHGGKQGGGWVIAVTSARSHLTIKFDNEADWTVWGDDISRCVEELQSERNNQRVLYRAVKSRRKLNGDGNNSGDNTPTAASGTTTPIHTADIKGSLGGHRGSGGGGYEGKDAVHSMIAEKLRELQLAKQHDGSIVSAGDEPSVSHNSTLPRRTSHPSTAFHTRNGSMDGLDSNSFSLPQPSPFGTVTGALERKAWRSPSATNQVDSLPAAGVAGGNDMVMPRAAGVGNVCVCLDREEGRRNSLKQGRSVSDGNEAVKDSRKWCPIHQLPEA